MESIVYATDWHQGRENLLPGAGWLASGDDVIEPLRRPTALVCSSRDVTRKGALARRQRDEMLISLIRETIAQGGKVLIPAATSARMLELAFVLNNNWRDNMDGPHADTYRNTKIYMASKSSKQTVRYLQSMLEWMESGVVQSVEAAMTAGRGQEHVKNPLDWKHVQTIQTQRQVDQALASNQPCILLASDASLDWGFSRQALASLANDPKNLVILTAKATNVAETQRGLACKLWDLHQASTGTKSGQSGARIVSGDGREVEICDVSTEDLTSEESGIYQQYLARQRQMHTTSQGDNSINEATTTEIADDGASESSESSDEDEEAEHQGRALNISAQLTQNKRKTGMSDAELGINILVKSKNVFDYDVRNKRGREKIFPFVSRRSKTDEYGDLIRAEDYLRAEERDDVDGIDQGSGGQADTTVGQKRKWGEAAGDKGRSNSHKRTKADPSRKSDDIDAMISRATGAGGAGAEQTGNAESDTDEEDEEPIADTKRGPQKAVYSTRHLTLRLRIAHVDFSGLAQQRDVENIVSRVRPRKLIIIAGDDEETQALSEGCKG